MAERTSSSALAIGATLVAVLTFAACGGDDRESDDTTRETSTGDTASDATTGAPDDDPGWTIDLPAEWTDISDRPSAAGVDGIWATGGGIDGFDSNVNVIEEETPESVDLEGYVDSLLGTVTFGEQTIDAGLHRRDDGTEYATIEQTTTTDDGVEAHALQVIVEVDGGFAAATFVAPEEVYAAELAVVRPTLDTLRAAS